MNGKLVDTNIIIYLSKRKLEFEQIASNEVTLSISVITYIEVLGYGFGNDIKKQTVKKLCDLFSVIGLNQEIVEK